MKTTVTKSDTLTLVGDACLFTAATFCLFIILPPLALLIGPGVAWLLHHRRYSWTVALAQAIGIVIALVTIGGFFIMMPQVANAIGPLGGWDLAFPFALLLIATLALVTVAIALDADSIRDLLPREHQHLRLDYARLVATIVVAVFGIGITVMQIIFPESEIGDAGVFALAAAAMGAVTMFVMQWLDAYSKKQTSPPLL